MKKLRRVGFVLAGVIAIILLLGVIAPKTAVIKSSAVVYAPVEIVFEQVNNLHNWTYWSPFTLSDSTMEFQIHGPQQGVGAQMLWKSNRYGSGMLIITSSYLYKSISMNIDFMDNEIIHGVWTFTPQDGATEISCSVVVNNLSYPFGRIRGLLIRPKVKHYFKLGMQRMGEEAIRARNSTKLSEVKMLGR